MTKRILCLLLAAGIPALAGCGDDDGTAPGDGFAVTVRVADAQGTAVEGIEVLTVMDSPFYQDVLAAKARVTIRFDLAAPAPVTLTIEDAAGGLVRTLLAGGVRPAGQHGVVWAGEDGDGVHQASGLYVAHLAVGDGQGGLLGEAWEPMYMALLAFDRGKLGETDADGRLVIRDKRLFPALYGQVEMDAVDETGQVIGAFPLTNTMRFYLRDPGDPPALRHDVEVTHAGQVIELLWTKAPPPKPRDAAGRPADKGVPQGDLPTGYKLYAPYPNPFN